MDFNLLKGDIIIIFSFIRKLVSSKVEQKYHVKKLQPVRDNSVIRCHQGFIQMSKRRCYCQTVFSIKRDVALKQSTFFNNLPVIKFFDSTKKSGFYQTNNNKNEAVSSKSKAMNNKMLGT